MFKSLALTAWVASGAVVGCSLSSDESTRSHIERQPLQSALEWSFSNCIEVREGPLCEINDREVVVWARTTTGRLEAPIHTGLTITSTESVDRGLRWRVRLTADRGEFKVRERVGGELFVGRLAFRKVVYPTCKLEIPRLNQASAPVRASVRAQIEALPEDDQPDCWRMAVVRSLPGTDAVDEILDWSHRAERGYRRAGRVRSAIVVASMRAYILFNGNRADDSVSSLAHFAETTTVSPGMIVGPLASFGMASHDLSEFYPAMRALQRSLTWSNRLDKRIDWRWAARYLLPTLERLGEHKSAERLAVDLVQHVEGVQTCFQKASLGAVHWWSLLARTRPFQPLDAPISATMPSIDLPKLRKEILAELLSCDEVVAADVLTNLALEALLLHEPERADELLAQVDRLTSEFPGLRRVRPWLAHARIEGDLAAGRPASALRRIDELERQPQPPGLAWIMSVRVAEAHHRLGNAERALAAWRETMKLAERWPGVVELDRSYGGLASSLQRAAQSQVGLLVKQGRVSEAIDTARWARSRALLAARRSDRLESLPAADRKRWSLLIGDYQRLRAQLDELALPTSGREARRVKRARRRIMDQAERKLREAQSLLWTSGLGASRRGPRPGELFIVVFAGRNDWLMMIDDGLKPQYASLIALKASKEELRRAMIRGLSQFDEVIERTKVVRVMAVGAADEIDIHALPWRGSPLFVAKPVVYGLDIGQRAYTEAPGERRALLVADPNPQDERRRLRFAQAEAERAESNLASSGWKTHRIVGRAATRSAVAAALERVELFHFAGHAWATGPVSRAALELAGGQQLQVPDVLALQRSPRVVILSACDSGRERGTVGAKRDMGVAQAFALAGAEMVVATTRLVDDRLASQVGRSLHESAAYAAMEAAQTIGRLQTKDDGDWSAFRVYVP